MKKGPITCAEIEKAIQETKSNSAPREDRITSDMLKAEPATSAKCLVGLFNMNYQGDLSQCGNWQGLNLLSVPGKVFCRSSFA